MMGFEDSESSAWDLARNEMHRLNSGGGILGFSADEGLCERDYPIFGGRRMSNNGFERLNKPEEQTEQ